MIGTTHFTNAVVEAKRLVSTAAVRLGLPATRALPPIVDWPERLRDAIGGHVYLCHGGHEFDGREIAPLDRDEIRRVAEDIRAKGIRSIAISSVFSPVNAVLEEEAAAILAEEVPGVPISLSHEIGRIGLLERENATIMNACLRELGAAHRRRVPRLRSPSSASSAPVYLSQNDGTLMSVDYAERYPVATFASGPTNSMRGAAFLSGLEDCAVVDIGGTTSDVGVLQHGFPREASVSVDIGGVRTNFRMPDVLSLGLGGGSIVRGDEPTIGPDSRRLRAHVPRARLRRRHADRERPRGRRGPRLVRRRERRRRPRPRSRRAGAGAGRADDRGGGRPDEDEPRPDPGRRRRRRQRAARRPAARAPRSSCGRITSRSRTRSAPRSRRSAARSSACSRSTS